MSALNSNKNKSESKKTIVDIVPNIYMHHSIPQAQSNRQTTNLLRQCHLMRTST